MGITEILRRIWLFSENKIKSSESFSKQPAQLIVKLNSSLRHITVTYVTLSIWGIFGYENKYFRLFATHCFTTSTLRQASYHEKTRYHQRN